MLQALLKLLSLICLSLLLISLKFSNQSSELPPASEPDTPIETTVDTPYIRPEFLALRDTISFAEGTWDVRNNCPGYTYRFGDKQGSSGSLDVTQPHPVYARRSPWGGSRGSNASGAYQYLDNTWIEMNDGTNAVMSPENQDRALYRLLETRIRYDFDRPFEQQVHLLAPTWASFPTRSGYSYYGQPVKSSQLLIDFYNERLEQHSEGAPTGASSAGCSSTTDNGTTNGSH